MESAGNKNNISFPEMRGVYKVVQVDIDGEPYDIYRTSKHADMLYEILIAKKVPFKYITFRSGAMGPALKGERYAVQGMGLAYIGSEKEILIYGDSYDYDIKIDINRAKRHAAFNPGWTVTE
jgi:hypothetical protein